MLFDLASSQMPRLSNSVRARRLDRQFKTRSFQKTRYKQRNTSITSISLSTTGRALCLQTHRLAPALYCSLSVFFGLFTLLAGGPPLVNGHDSCVSACLSSSASAFVGCAIVAITAVTICALPLAIAAPIRCCQWRCQFIACHLGGRWPAPPYCSAMVGHN